MPNRNKQPARERNPQQQKRTTPREKPESSGETATGERDESYNLVSVLYHALQSAETMAQYIRDAEEADDDELAQFFNEVRENEVDIAQRARVLLSDRLEDASEDEGEDEDEASATAE